MGRTGSFDLHEATLTNIVDGALEMQFQEGMQRVAGIFECVDDYQCDKDGTVIAKVVMEVEIHRTITGEETIYASADVKAPKRKKAGRPVWYRNGTWSVMQAEQLNLLETTATRVKDPAPEGGE